jgi:hypothetical protein
LDSKLEVRGAADREGGTLTLDLGEAAEGPTATMITQVSMAFSKGILGGGQNLDRLTNSSAVGCRSPRQEAQEGQQSQQQEEAEGQLTASGNLASDPQVSNLPVKWAKFQAGRISSQYAQWKQLTTDRLLLKDVKAYAIEFDELPSQRFPERPLRFSWEKMQFARDEIAQLLEKGVLCEA